MFQFAGKRAGGSQVSGQALIEGITWILLATLILVALSKVYGLRYRAYRQTLRSAGEFTRPSFSH